jgi:tetratricopeptide (TPR) repeat protein
MHWRRIDVEDTHRDANQRRLRLKQFFYLRASAFLCVLLILWNALHVISQTNQTQPEDWLTEGKRHIAEGHFSEAVAAFNRFKQTAPQDPRPYFFSGIALAESGHFSAAAAELGEAVRLAPEQPEYLVSQANVLTRLGQKNQAVKILAKFANKEFANQLSTAGLWQLSDIYYRLQKTDDALRTLELLSQRDPKDPNIDLRRGQIYKLIGNLDLAERSFKKNLEASPHNAPAYFELAKLWEQRNEMAASKSALLEALRQDGNNPEYLRELGSVCLALSEVDEAISYLTRAEPAASNFPEIYYTLAQAYQRKGDQAKAATYLNLQKVHKINSSRRKKEIQEQAELTLITLGEEKLDQGNRAEARALFEQVLQTNPDNWHANEYLAKIFLSTEEWQLAERRLEKMEQIDPESAEGNFLSAYYWYHRQNFQRARTYAERAKTVQPGDAELRNLLGNVYLKLSQPDKALEEYSAAVRLAPTRTDFQANLKAVSPQNSLPK